MAASTLQARDRVLQNLPYPARPRVDPGDVEVPEGYQVEALVTGLNFPNSLAFADDGTLYIAEGGSAWPLRPYVGARVLALTPQGELEEVVRDPHARITGLAVHGDHLLAAHEGYPSRIVRYTRDEGRFDGVVVDGLPAGGLHPPTGPVVGPDGSLYFGQGTAGLNGFIEPQIMGEGGALRHPGARDVPGQDITLNGHNIESSDPRKPLPMPVRTGAYKAYGTPSEPGEVVEGRTLCTTSVIRSEPDGSNLELLAWGIRVGYGMTFDDRGRLWVSDNNMEDAGLRPVANDPERVWHVENAERPHGSVSTPSWYGFPDICADGKPVTHPEHAPTRGSSPKRLIQDPPDYAGPAPIQLEPHSCPVKLDAAPRNAPFGHGGDLFLAHLGSFAPRTTGNPEALNRGFQVARIDPDTGAAEPFMRNRRPGPATPVGPRNARPSGGSEPQADAAEADGRRGRGGVERPIDAKFDPLGQALYVLDLGRLDVSKGGTTTWGRTGVLWRVTPQDGRGVA